MKKQKTNRIKPFSWRDYILWGVLIILCFCVFLIPWFISSNEIWGHELENFVEYEKIGTVSIPDEISTIIYLKREIQKPSHLIIKDLMNETKEIISQFSDTILRARVDIENQRLYYILSDMLYKKAYLHSAE